MDWLDRARTPKSFRPGLRISYRASKGQAPPDDGGESRSHRGLTCDSLQLQLAILCRAYRRSVDDRVVAGSLRDRELLRPLPGTHCSPQLGAQSRSAVHNIQAGRMQRETNSRSLFTTIQSGLQECYTTQCIRLNPAIP